MAQSRVIDITPLPAWADPWAHPEYFRSITMKRIFAYLIDFTLVGLIAIAVWFAFGILGLATFGLLLPLQALAVALVPLAYHILLIAGSATLGMRAMGIRVMSIAPTADGGRPTLFQAMIQTVAFYGSIAMTTFLILAVALFNPRRRMLHDWMAGTVVVNDLGRWHSPIG
ncbi:MAG TPA: RDD family protein [Candidatus Omnitrophota bacterium]|nr:RDD family protein [Candidatus Omnitrophota bacterium]